MPEERKTSNPRTVQLRFPPVRGSLVPVARQAQLVANTTKKQKNTTNRSICPPFKPVSPFPKVTEVLKKTLIPAPPTTRKSPSRKRPESKHCNVTYKRRKNCNLADVGKYAQQKENQNSLEAEVEIAKNIAPFQEENSTVADETDLKMKPLFNQKIPPPLDFFLKKGFKIPSLKSFAALSNGSRIPVLIDLSSKSRKENLKNTSSRSFAALSIGSRIPVLIHSSNSRKENLKNTSSKSFAALSNGSHIPVLIKSSKSRDARFKSKRVTPKENKPATPTGSLRVGDPSAAASGSKNSNNNQENIIANNDERPVSQYRLEPLRLAGILPSNFTPQRESSEFEREISEISCNCKPRQVVNQSVVSEIVKEFEKLKDHITDVKIRQCSKPKNGKYESMCGEEADHCIDANTDTVKYIRALASNMNMMVHDIDLDITCIQKASKEIVGTMVVRLRTSEDTYREHLLQHEKEILRLQGENKKLGCSVVEGEAMFRSLGKALDKTNEEYQKLQARNTELLEENNQHLAAFEKMNEDLMFRAKELGSEDLLEENKRLAAKVETAKRDADFRARELTNLHQELQRRDTRASQLVDDYQALWRERCCLSLRVVALEGELKQREVTGQSLYEQNTLLERQIAALEDKVKELQVSVTSQVASYESKESTNSEPGMDPITLGVAPEHKDSQQIENLATAKVTEHGVIDENGKTINGLAESPKRISTAAFGTFKKKIYKPHFITGDGRKIQRYQTKEQNRYPEQMNKNVSILKMMSDKIQSLGMKNVQNGRVYSTDTTQGTVDVAFDNMHERSIHNQTDVVASGENAKDIDQGKTRGTVEESFDRMDSRSFISKSFAETTEETIEETKVEKVLAEGREKENTAQERCEDHVDELAVAVQREKQYDKNNTFQENIGGNGAIAAEGIQQDSSPEVDTSILAQEKSYVQNHEDAVIQVNTDLELVPEIRNANFVQDKNINHQDVIAPQEMRSKMLQLELCIQEQNKQLEELQNMVETLRESNVQLENDKVQIISENQGFILENMQEAKRLKELEEMLNEKESALEEKLKKLNVSATKVKKINLKDKEADWYSECRKALQRVRHLEVSMMKHDKLFKKFESEKQKLLQENKNLKTKIENTSVTEDVSFAALPKTVQGLEDIVKELRRSKVVIDGVRKKVRCFTKSDAAIQELQQMQQNTLVISVGDFSLSEEEQEKQAQATPVTQEQLLINKAKLIKRHRMKNIQDRLFTNSDNVPDIVRSANPGSGGGLSLNSLRKNHKRKNPSILPFNGRLDGIKEIREEPLDGVHEEKIEECYSKRFDETTKKPASKNVDEASMKAAVDAAEVTVKRKVVSPTATDILKNKVRIIEDPFHGIALESVKAVAKEKAGDTVVESVKVEADIEVRHSFKEAFPGASDAKDEDLALGALVATGPNAVDETTSKNNAKEKGLDECNLQADEGIKELDSEPVSEIKYDRSVFEKAEISCEEKVQVAVTKEENAEDKGELPSTTALFESVRCLEILKESLTKEPSVRRKRM